MNQKRKKEKIRRKAIYKEIIANDFVELKKEQCQSKVFSILRRILKNWSIPRQWVVKLKSIKDEEKILEVTREKRLILQKNYNEPDCKFSNNRCLNSMDYNRKIVLKVLRENMCQPGNNYFNNLCHLGVIKTRDICTGTDKWACE